MCGSTTGRRHWSSMKEALAATQGSSALQCCSPMARSLTATPSRPTHTEAPGHAELGKLSWDTHAGASHTSHQSRTAPLSRGQQGSPVLMALQGRHSLHRLTLVLLKSRLGYRKGRTWLCKQDHLYCGCEASSGMAECQMAFDHDHAIL